MNDYHPLCEFSTCYIDPTADNMRTVVAVARKLGYDVSKGREARLVEIATNHLLPRGQARLHNLAATIKDMDETSPTEIKQERLHRIRQFIAPLR